MSEATLKPPTTLGLAPSFGFGDRLGMATPGHVESLKRAGGAIRPIFAQQSIREMTRTSRSPQQVMDDAMAGMRAAGFSGVHGADADHLKTPTDVDRTAAVGFVFFTIDPSDHVDPHADEYDADTLATKFKAVAGEVDWVSRYAGKSVKLPTGSIELSEAVCRRAAVKYGKAINHTVSLAAHIEKLQKSAGKPFEIELSVDETPHPTTAAEHYIIADQCRTRGVKNLVSLAPRFVGEFEKGVDFKGDRGAFERSLAEHSAIAEMVGPYKLSLHSGSDKLSIYPAFARATKGRFHVKTAGTSYLEALRVVARHDQPLFRKVIDFGRGRYDTDRATYHVSATLQTVPPPSAISDPKKLEQTYLELWSDVPAGKGFTAPGRQILHCTFGSVLTDPTLGPAVKQVVKENPKTYTEILADHFARHLKALSVG